jgi:hypothetical protein
LIDILSNLTKFANFVDSGGNVMCILMENARFWVPRYMLKGGRIDIQLCENMSIVDGVLVKKEASCYLGKIS